MGTRYIFLIGDKMEEETVLLLATFVISLAVIGLGVYAALTLSLTVEIVLVQAAMLLALLVYILLPNWVI